MIINATLSGVDTTATATAADILASKTAWVNDEKITGTIATKTSSNLTASGATVTVPAGYYASNASKSIANGSATTPATTITQSTPSVTIANSTGVVTASVAQKTQNVTPTVSAGYVSSGTAGTITLGASSGTLSLTTQAAKTVTPTTSSQTAVAANRWTTGAVTVAAIPSNYKPLSSTTAVAADIAKGKTAYNGSGTLLTGTKPVPLRSSPLPQFVTFHINNEEIGDYDEGWKCIIGDNLYCSTVSQYSQRSLTSHYTTKTNTSVTNAYWTGSSGRNTVSCFSGNDFYILNTYRKYSSGSLSETFYLHKLTSSGITAIDISSGLKTVFDSAFGTSSEAASCQPIFMQAINGVIYLFIFNYYSSSSYKTYFTKYTISSNTWTSATQISALDGYVFEYGGWSSEQAPSIAWNNNIYAFVRNYSSNYRRYIKITTAGAVTFLTNEAPATNSNSVGCFFKRDGNLYATRNKSMTINNTTVSGKCIYQITSSNTVTEYALVGHAYDSYATDLDMDMFVLTSDYLPIFGTGQSSDTSRIPTRSLFEIVF